MPHQPRKATETGWAVGDQKNRLVRGWRRRVRGGPWRTLLLLQSAQSEVGLKEVWNWVSLYRQPPMKKSWVEPAGLARLAFTPSLSYRSRGLNQHLIKTVSLGSEYGSQHLSAAGAPRLNRLSAATGELFLMLRLYIHAPWSRNARRCLASREPGPLPRLQIPTASSGCHASLHRHGVEASCSTICRTPGARPTTLPPPPPTLPPATRRA